MAKPDVDNINIKNYYDDFYKDYGGVEGLYKKRLLADPNLNLTTEESDYPEKVMQYKGNKAIPFNNYRNILMENPRRTVNITNDPASEGTPGDYDSNTDTIRIQAEENTPKSGLIQHHEMAHKLQDINGKIQMGYNSYMDTINSIEADKGKLSVPYNMRRDEIDAQMAQIARGYKNATGKVIITEQDAEDAWNYLMEGHGSKVPAYFNSIGLTKEHFKKLSRKIAYNTDKILIDPNYA